MEELMFAEKNIKKHVAIIHAFSLMSVLQRKIVNALFYEAINNETHRKNENSIAVEYRISFSKLAKDIAFNSKNTQYLKEAIDGLASLKIVWNLLKDKAPADISFLNMRILHGSPTFYQDGTFNFSFHKLLLDLINTPSVYGTISLNTQAKFESKYGHALYENSTRFVNLNKSKVLDLTIVRQLLGVDKNNYQSMREFSRNVINPAMEEVNDVANFTVNLEKIKQGRKIIAFELYAKNKETKVERRDIVHEILSEKVCKEISQTFGFVDRLILNKLANNYSEEYILDKIKYTKIFAKKNANNLYPIAYFISALRDNYQISKIDTNLPDNRVGSSDRKLDKNLTSWQDENNFLQSDLRHWQNILKDKQKNCDNGTIIELEAIISRCEEKLNEHYKEKPEKISE